MGISQFQADIVDDLIAQFSLAVSGERLDDAHKLLEELAEHDAELAAQPHNDAAGALRALQDGGVAVDGLRAICLRALGDPTWQGIAESIIENSDDRAEREAMCALLDREPNLAWA
jgi:Bacterial type III secretion protein (HrpB1_HrpK)